MILNYRLCRETSFRNFFLNDNRKKHVFNIQSPRILPALPSFSESLFLHTLSVKKKPVKSDKFFSGDQYFSLTNNFTRLKLTPTKDFYQFFFVLNKSQITEILKRNYQIYYTIIWLSGVG